MKVKNLSIFFSLFLLLILALPKTVFLFSIAFVMNYNTEVHTEWGKNSALWQNIEGEREWWRVVHKESGIEMEIKSKSKRNEWPSNIFRKWFAMQMFYPIHTRILTLCVHYVHCTVYSTKSSICSAMMVTKIVAHKMYSLGN